MTVIHLIILFYVVKTGNERKKEKKCGEKMFYLGLEVQQMSAKSGKKYHLCCRFTTRKLSLHSRLLSRMLGSSHVNGKMIIGSLENHHSTRRTHDYHTISLRQNSAIYHVFQEL